MEGWLLSSPQRGTDLCKFPIDQSQPPRNSNLPSCECHYLSGTESLYPRSHILIFLYTWSQILTQAHKYIDTRFIPECQFINRSTTVRASVSLTSAVSSLPIVLYEGMANFH